MVKSRGYPTHFIQKLLSSTWGRAKRSSGKRFGFIFLNSTNYRAEHWDWVAFWKPNISETFSCNMFMKLQTQFSHKFCQKYLSTTERYWFTEKYRSWELSKPIKHGALTVWYHHFDSVFYNRFFKWIRPYPRAETGLFQYVWNRVRNIAETWVTRGHGKSWVRYLFTR